MTTQTEALNLALEALDQLTNAADTFSVSGVYFNEEVWAKKCLSDAYFAITAIEQALAQPEQEPLAWIEHHKGGDNLNWEEVNHSYAKATPLYTTPPQRTWVGLTDEEVNELVEHTECEDYYGLVEATEAKLKDKNT